MTTDIEKIVSMRFIFSTMAQIHTHVIPATQGKGSEA